MRFCGIHLRAISEEILKISILNMSLNITNLKLQPHLPGTNELNTGPSVMKYLMPLSTTILSDVLEAPRLLHNPNIVVVSRADFRFAPSQWETVLLCNNVSHWLGANLESALCKTVSGYVTNMASYCLMLPIVCRIIWICIREYLSCNTSLVSCNALWGHVTNVNSRCFSEATESP